MRKALWGVGLLAIMGIALMTSKATRPGPMLVDGYLCLPTDSIRLSAGPNQSARAAPDCAGVKAGDTITWTGEPNVDWYLSFPEPGIFESVNPEPVAGDVQHIRPGANGNPQQGQATLPYDAHYDAHSYSGQYGGKSLDPKIYVVGTGPKQFFFHGGLAYLFYRLLYIVEFWRH